MAHWTVLWEVVIIEGMLGYANSPFPSANAEKRRNAGNGKQILTAIVFLPIGLTPSELVSIVCRSPSLRIRFVKEIIGNKKNNNTQQKKLLRIR